MSAMAPPHTLAALPRAQPAAQPGPPWTGGPRTASPVHKTAHRPSQPRSATWLVKLVSNVDPGTFAEKPPTLLEINPQFGVVQK